MKNEMNDITNFQSFVKWHSEKWGNCYNTPKSIEDVKRRIIHLDKFASCYDSENDCFYGFMGQYAENPGERYDISWREIAQKYSSMYNSFASYGTN